METIDKDEDFQKSKKKTNESQNESNNHNREPVQQRTSSWHFEISSLLHGASRSLVQRERLAQVFLSPVFRMAYREAQAQKHAQTSHTVRARIFEKNDKLPLRG